MLDPPRRGPAYKTKLCALWQRGGCSRDACSFAHGGAELRRLPGSRTPFPPRAGRRDYRGDDFRERFDRRRSPCRRYSLERDSRGHHSLHDRRPTSQGRESSISRSPSRKSERRHEKKPGDGETNSSRSLSVSDKNDDRKMDKFSSGQDKEDNEKHLKQIREDMELLRDDKSHLEIILEDKNAEVHTIFSRINDLDLQLKKKKEECHRMTSKMKKFIKAHGRFLKAREELKRSQSRFERLVDSLASDILKCAANEGSSIDVDEDLNDHGRNAASPKKRLIPYSTSEEAKAVKKKREPDSDTISRPEKYRSEDTVAEFDKQNKGSKTTKSLYLKERLWEDEKDKLGNDVSSANTYKVKDSPVKRVLPSTGMAAHALDDLIEAVELEDRHEPMDASLENDADDETTSPVMPPCQPPIVNAYVQYEGDDVEVDVD